MQVWIYKLCVINKYFHPVSTTISRASVYKTLLSIIDHSCLPVSVQVAFVMQTDVTSEQA